ncbi:hypothetical protein F2P81_004279 [Scophthalmus maximus]|uniref:Uncharacterized protein n=1 Tax=Scophthalmus maximus TaxID=52904 RepID=A0A6A4TLR8_SCOMX|nr:hypothetical protein F2P81_004279 [Scophthalmus maximus]
MSRRRRADRQGPTRSLLPPIEGDGSDTAAWHRSAFSLGTVFSANFESRYKTVEKMNDIGNGFHHKLKKAPDNVSVTVYGLISMNCFTMIDSLTGPVIGCLVCSVTK